METSILKVKSDLLTAMDNRKVTSPVLLDLSAAFYTMKHKLLLNRLKYRFSIDSPILQWIESYLTNHIQRVKVDNLESDQVTLTFGVPQ